MCTEQIPPLLRILCIHGYRQNALSFREKTGAFRKLLKKHAELVFITAPNQVPPLMSSEGNGDLSSSENNPMGWWFSRPDDYFQADEYTDFCKGYKESLQLIIEVIEEQGPFHGVLGFSQGAAMVSLLCGIQEQDPDKKWFDFAILVAGFKSRTSSHDNLYAKKITIPTLHVFGEIDKVIPREMSEDLMQYFEDCVTLKHAGGHFIPASGQQKNVYLEFLEKMKQKVASL